MKNKFSEKEFKEIYNKVPRLCVDLLIEYNGGILLTKRAITPWKDLWHFPGGTVYLEESLEEACKRVAKEETNLEIEIIKTLRPMEFSSNEEGQKKSISFAFFVKATSKDIILNEQATKYRIIKGDIPENSIPEHKELLEEFLRNNKL